MTAPTTRKVSFDLFQVIGTALAGARVVFTLNHGITFTVNGGGVVPAGATTGVSDDQGLGSVNLVPNSIGDYASQYGVEIYDVQGNKVFPVRGVARMYLEDQDSQLHAILFSVAPMSQSDADRAVTESRNWAQYLTGDVPSTPGARSAKSWAQENLAGATYGGSSKDWAQTPGSIDGGNGRSSWSWAQADLRGALGGSARDWAIGVGLIDGVTYKSSMAYAVDAQAAAGAASASQQATAADRVQTGLDRTQTGIDRAAAATSRAQMLYIVQGSFDSGTPPTLRDDGSAIQAGDFASFTDNTFRRYNGVTWIASDINAALLAAANGASLIGYDSVTVQQLLDTLPAFNLHRLHAAFDAVRKLETTASPGPFYFGITGYGDSMASDSYTVNVLARALQARYGLGGLFTPGFGQSWLGAAWTFTGGAAQARTDWTYLPGANQVTMPVASTAQIQTGVFSTSSTVRNTGALPLEFDQKDDSASSTLGFVKVRCFYLTRPGDGSLSFTLSQTNITGYSANVVSCNAALGLSYVDIPVLDFTKRVTLNVAASTAACVFVGAVFLRESGVLFWLSQVGGSTMDQQKPYLTNGSLAAVYSPLCAALSTALFVHAQRVPGDANWQANYVQVFSALDGIAGTSQLVLGEPPRLLEDTPTVAQINTYLRAQCFSRGYGYIDQNRIMGSSYATLSALGWGGDGTHLDIQAHRYLAGKILQAVDWFRLGANKLDMDPLTMGQFLKRRIRMAAQQGVQSYTISGRASVTMDNQAVSGGYTFAPTNQRGFVLAGAAALGYVSGCPGPMPCAANVDTTRVDLAISFVGYRNLSLVAGNRAFALVGVTTAITTLTTLAQRCFGVEFAKGSDVGSPSGTTTEVMRLVACDGVTRTFGDWVNATTPGFLGTSNGGLKFAITWNRTKTRLILWRSSNAVSFEMVSSLTVADLAANGCAGSYVNLCLLAEDGANIPLSASAFSMLEIKSAWGDYASTYGLTGNNLIET